MMTSFAAWFMRLYANQQTHTHRVKMIVPKGNYTKA